ncbi:pyridoxal phosphate-dependent aminotransferase [Salinirubrum litoreum]|uniref:Aminotransferase n=1 Tax=Salinirubrum litoreum TaxID=1126234 RepID=A0ABD5R9Q5_9EURY|nr:pyridoxal phosphate-dependent aminotransferase [Salinirubrum litoreum]
MFPAMPYLRWIDGRPATATYDLGSSDLRPDTPTDGVVPRPLAGYEDPPTDASLREQLAAAYGVTPEEVLVTAGATHANFLAEVTALSLTDGDDSDDVSETTAEGADSSTDSEPQVLVEKPGYQPLTATAASLGANVNRFLRPPDDDYRLSPTRVENAVTDEFALVTVTNRHNPSGRLTTRETLTAVARVAADAGGFLLVDEVYAPYVGTAGTTGDTAGDPQSATDGTATARTAFGGVTAAGLPNTVTTGSLTKFYGLGGLRIGWLIAPTRFVARARTVATHVPAVAEPSRVLARRALHHEERLAERQRALLAENHDRLSSFVADRGDLSGTVHAGSSFALLAHESADGDTVAERAWDEGLLVVPGRFFDRTESFRLSLGRDAEEVAGGLRVLGDVLDAV